MSLRSSNVKSWHESFTWARQHVEQSSKPGMTAAWHMFGLIIVGASEEMLWTPLYRIDKGTSSAVFVFEMTVCFRYL